MDFTESAASDNVLNRIDVSFQRVNEKEIKVLQSIFSPEYSMYIIHFHISFTFCVTKMLQIVVDMTHIYRQKCCFELSLNEETFNHF